MAAGAADHPAVAKGIDYLVAHPGNRRPVGRGALHRNRVPAGVLPSLPRLSEILSALGTGALQQSPGRPIGRVRDVDAAIIAIAGGCRHRPDLRGTHRLGPGRRHGLRWRPSRAARGRSHRSDCARLPRHRVVRHRRRTGGSSGTRRLHRGAFDRDARPSASNPISNGRAICCRTFPAAIHADIAGVTVPVCTPADKVALGARHQFGRGGYGICCCARQWRRRNGLPFAAIRVVADPEPPRPAAGRADQPAARRQAGHARGDAFGDGPAAADPRSGPRRARYPHRACFAGAGAADARSRVRAWRGHGTEPGAATGGRACRIGSREPASILGFQASR